MTLTGGVSGGIVGYPLKRIGKSIGCGRGRGWKKLSMICPKCHSSNFYQATDSLYRFRCPDCKAEFTLKPAVEEVEKVVFAGLDESCWVEMTCPKCGEKIKEWVSQFKQPFKCPKCKQKYTYILDVKVIKG